MPGLDGLRAISIVFVIISHLLWMPSFPWHWIAAILNPGDLGVRIFFVISGFLITTLLVREKENTGTISLLNFYRRRTLRIFPAYYTFLVCVFLLVSYGVLYIEPVDYLYSITYTFNFKGQQGTWWLGHTWSLAVEEQFYLLWPLVVRGLNRYAVLWVAVFWASVGPLLRVATLVRGTAFSDRWGSAFPLVADPIAVGAILAIVLSFDRPRELLKRVVAGRAAWLAPIVGLALASLANRPRMFPHPLIFTAVCLPLVNIGIAIFIAKIVSSPRGFIGYILNCPAIVAIGVLSYSLYLWQMLFIHSVSVPWLMAFPLNLVWLVVVAMLSFLLIERPFNRYGHRRKNHHVLPSQTESVTVIG
jgi:peptidoglycan/LPS O-acetylase OafA/YrhL